LQLDLFTYPRRPGWKRRATSRDSAKAATNRAATLRDKSLQAIRSWGAMTADEIAAELGESVLSIRPRVAELANLGEIIDSKARRKNKSGRPAIVWQLRA
jgi:predicted ArsR family transcriptional regulator